MNILDNILDMKMQYNKYLTQHISGVQQSFNLAREALINKGVDPVVVDYCARMLIGMHDSSKYSSEEYDAYCTYFYGPGKKTKEVEQDFDRAWLHHQKCNPHHWQYWVLIRDEGELVPMDMPTEYIIEMLCDWNSFSQRNPESTAKKWYYDNKDKMIFSEDTRKIIEDLLEIPVFTDGLGKKEDSNESNNA